MTCKGIMLEEIARLRRNDNYAMRLAKARGYKAGVQRIDARLRLYDNLESFVIDKLNEKTELKIAWHSVILDSIIVAVAALSQLWFLVLLLLVTPSYREEVAV